MRLHVLIFEIMIKSADEVYCMVSLLEHVHSTLHIARLIQLEIPLENSFQLYCDVSANRLP